jgi:DNA repair exonuclease SbcCD ATPase subunit
VKKNALFLKNSIYRSGGILMAGKSKAKKNADTSQEAGGMMGAGNLDNIREILFGAQAQQYEQKFNRLEELLKKELHSLREERKKSLNSLEHFVKKEFESLADELNSEKRERTETVEDISESLQNSTKNLEKKITKLDDKNIKVQREVQEQILKQSKELLEEIRSKHEEISSALNEAVKDLTDRKADRVALANLLTEMSMRLKEEFSLPE